MKRFIKSGMGFVLRKLGIIALLRDKFPNKDLTVLMYHQVEGKNFEEQVAYIKKYYNPISEKQLLDYYNNKIDLPKNSVLLTFDDGYYNNYKYAYPALKKHNVPAVIFLVTGLIGKHTLPWYDQVDYIINKTKEQDVVVLSKKFKLTRIGKSKLKKECYFYMINTTTKERKKLLKELQNKLKVSQPKTITEQYTFMDWKQIKEISDIFSIGGHTYMHPILPNETIQEQEYQIKKSYDDLTSKGITPLSFCYPNGDYSQDTINIVKKYFKIAYSVNFGKTNKDISRFLIQRVAANIHDSKDILAVKLTILRRLFNKTKKTTNFKVIHLTNYYYPQTGGITTAVHSIKSFLDQKSIPNEVVAYPHFFRKIENFFGQKTIVHRFLVLIYAFFTLLRVALIKLRYKNIVVHSHSANFCARVGLLTTMLGTKTIHTFHTDPHMDNEQGIIQPRPFLNKLDSLTAVSNKLAKDSSHIYRTNKEIDIIFNTVEEIKPIHTPKKKSSTLKVTMVGHLLPIKDPLFFIKSIEELSKSTKVKGQIIGDGPLRAELEDYIKKNKVPVTLLGSLEHSTVLNEVASSDVFTLPSKGEGLGTVLLEAISLNVPVVATNVGGISEIVTDKVTGVLVHSRRPQEMAKAILQAHKGRKTYVKEASKLLNTKFDEYRNMSKYLSLYCYLTKEKVAKSSQNEN